LLPRALVVSNAKELVTSIRLSLTEAGFDVVAARDAFEGIKRVYDRHPDIVIMEDGLSSIDSVDLCSHIYSLSCIPVILLGAEVAGDSLIHGLQRGADFYMRRPISIAELVARVKSLLRRNEGWPESVRRLLNVEERRALVADRWVSLTVTEFRLISYLMLNEGRVIPVEELLTQVWAGEEIGSSSLSHYIFRLRQKLNHSTPHNIYTHHGVGYRFGDANEDESDKNTAGDRYAFEGRGPADD
jgi:DNA-binding response OmpR family regulator